MAGVIMRNGVAYGVGTNAADNVLMNSVTLGNTRTVQQVLETHDTLINAMLLRAHPIGSIYLTESTENPSITFGGTWSLLKDRFLVGAGNTYAVNATGGAARETLDVTQIPAHNHDITSTAAAGGVDHYHYLSIASSGVDLTHYHGASTSSAGNHTHTLNIQANVIASGGAVDRVSNSTVTNVWANPINEAGAHTHSISMDNALGTHSHTTSGNTGWSSAYSHGHTITSSSTNKGDGLSHNNLPPYLAVYMWLRTA